MIKRAITLSFIGCFLLTAITHGAILAEYDAGPAVGGPADIDPVLQGWVENEVNDGSAVPGDQNVFFLHPDGTSGYNAVQLNDQHGNTATDNPRYEIFLSLSDFQAMHDNGWEYAAQFKVIQGGGFSGWGWSGANDIWGAGGRDRFGISVSFDATDPTAIKITTQDGYTYIGASGSAADYHTVLAVGNAGTSTYDLYIDGVFQVTDNLLDGGSNASSDNRVLWESGSSAATGRVVNWNYVSLSIVDSPITIVPDTGNVEVTELDSTSDSYTITLNSEPNDLVTITITPDGGPAGVENIDLGSGPGIAVQRVFDADNWETPQTVIVTAVDDAYPEGTHTVIINNVLTSSDLSFNGLVRTIPVTIIDDDIIQKEINFSSQPFISPKGSYVTVEELYHTFRIPGMVVAADGSILTFAEGRRGDGSDPRRDDNAPMDMTMRRSSDNGQTWDDLVVIDPGFKASGAKVDFGDPTPVLDETTGDVFLCYGQFPDLGSSVSNWGQDHNSADGNHVVWIQSSSDGGLTWSGPNQIVYPDEPGETADGLYWRQAEPGPGSGIQLRWQTNPLLNGRLIIPAKRSASVTVDGSAISNGFVYYSDDHGATWQVGDVASAGGNENEVVELISGELLLDARATPRTRFTSSTGGNTWSDAPHSDVPITAVDASMIRYSAIRDGDDRDRLLFSGPGGNPVGSGSGRYNQLVWTSYDEGQTFINPVQFVFDNEQSAYSVLAKLQNDSIGMLVETSGDEPFNMGQNYGDITYLNFDIDYLEGMIHRAELTHYDGFGNSIDRKRGGVGWSGSWNAGANFTDVFAAELGGGSIIFEGFKFQMQQGRVDLVTGQSTQRNLATSIDLNSNGTTYISLLLSTALDTSSDDASLETLRVELRDSGSAAHVSFGIDSDESLSIQSPGLDVKTGAATLSRSGIYYLVAKIVAQDDSSGGNYDQVYLKLFESGMDAIPDYESGMAWTLAGSIDENSSGLINQIVLQGGSQVTWSLDEVRIAATYEAVAGNPPYCGQSGTVYYDSDFNQDCYVDILDLRDIAIEWLNSRDLSDFVILADEWLKCTNPSDPLNCTLEL